MSLTQIRRFLPRMFSAIPAIIQSTRCNSLVHPRPVHPQAYGADRNRWMDSNSLTCGHYSHYLEVVRPEDLGSSIPAFRVVDETGSLLDPSLALTKTDQTKLVEIYRQMKVLACLDKRLMSAYTAGLISLYVTSEGEEACQIASAAALQPEDLIFSQYRDPGSLLWRGMSPETLIDQCFGNVDDLGKGRQMPTHYGSRQHNYVTISSPIATQIPHAVGAAYAYKRAGRDACVVTNFGEGSTSTGDFHAALNFASTLKVPVVFFCRNNRLAIATPVQEQMACDGVVERGPGYGMWTIRVDGNDALAVHQAMLKARETAMTESRPILVEAMTYRVGNHSSNVDSCEYRDKAVPALWRHKNNPFVRLKNYLSGEGLWNARLESECERDVNDQIEAAFDRSQMKPKPEPGLMFTDVYHDMPAHLKAQRTSLMDVLSLHAQKYGKPK